LEWQEHDGVGVAADTQEGEKLDNTVPRGTYDMRG
jgi:hypothetical protein